MHITYETKQTETEVTDPNIQTQIITKKEAAAAILQAKHALEKRIMDLKNEQQYITQTCVELSLFLHKNAITPYNDDLIECVNHLIREEKNKSACGSNNQNVIDGLERMII
ncbi:unnamed protein product [Didymodactylos carnosus]|uniref:Uncharacterized protein n=1 Tax=Didymodactylos carnosus TaxID=1234261 RepID=A0A815C4J8_9BILA|nr:unnamed protein product [Didymodactylos carnosus]CAF4072420.1 unnamed protein product [Didymodactylos carnosus]